MTLVESPALIYAPLDRIVVNPFQPRKVFRDEEIDELAASIKEVGLLHPIVVRPSLLLPDFFELVAGERRFRACQSLRWEKVQAQLWEVGDGIAAQAALIENLHRSDLNPLEIAKAFRSVLEQNRWNQEELAERMGKKRSTVANYLRLMTLPQSGQSALSEGKITMGHAKAVLALPLKREQEELIRRIIKHGWSVRQAEQWNPVKEPKVLERDIHVADVEEQLQRIFGTKVRISGRGKKGKIAIDYFSSGDLERILELLHIQGENNE